MKELEELLAEMARRLPPNLKARLVIELSQPSSREETSGVAQDLNTEQLAKRFDRSTGTILDWIHRGYFGEEGEGWYRIGRAYYVKPGALDMPGRSCSRTAGSLSLPRRRRERVE